jgi:hypothetical protein
MADTATESAMATIAKGPIPRRASRPDPLSLLNKNACDAGRSPQFPANVPNIDPAGPTLPGFAGWRCTWGTDRDPVKLWVEFARRSTFDEDIGRRIQVGAQPAEILGQTDKDTCEVNVAEQPYQGAYEKRMETIAAYAQSPGKTQQERCDLAVKLADAAAAG